MNVLFDGQIFRTQRVGGVSRVFARLFDGLDLEDRVDWSVIMDFPDNLYIQELEGRRGPLTRYSRFLGGSKFRGKGRLYTAYCALSRQLPERSESIETIHKGEIDLFHPTYYDDYFLDKLRGVPFVLTVFDMIHELYPQLLPDAITVDRKRRLIQRAARIIAISQSTKNDLVRLMGVEEDRIDVVHLANLMFSGLNKVRSLVRPEKYILFVGERGGYKNFRRFFHGVARLMRDDRELYLVCIGGQNHDSQFPKEESCFIDSTGVAHQVLLRSATDDELALWYQGAQCLVFPSLYEGFGLPILEAFDNNCPVAVSNTSSMREVGGACVMYFDPESVDSICKTIQELLNSSELQRHLCTAAKERATQFSIRRMVEKTVDVYDTALSQHR